jgi:hypothetical protein
MAASGMTLCSGIQFDISYGISFLRLLKVHCEGSGREFLPNEVNQLP